MGRAIGAWKYSVCAGLTVFLVVLLVVLAGPSQPESTVLPRVRRSTEREDVATEAEEALEVICKPASTGGTRPVLVFVVGAEGTGHHLVAGILSHLPKVKILDKVIRQYFAEIWEPFLDEERREQKREELRSLLKSAGRTRNVTHFLLQSPFEMFSFPYDDPRNHLRRPDLLELISLVEPYFDLRMLVTLRDPASAIASLVRRNYWSQEKCQQGVSLPTDSTLYTSWPLGDCGFIGYQAKVVEDALVYIASQLEVISQRYYRTIHFEEYLADPVADVRKLSRFIRYQGWQEVGKVTGEHIAPHREDYTQLMTEMQRETIAASFSPTRARQWGYLLREELRLSLVKSASWKIVRKERCSQRQATRGL